MRIQTRCYGGGGWRRERVFGGLARSIAVNRWVKKVILFVGWHGANTIPRTREDGYHIRLPELLQSFAAIHRVSSVTPTGDDDLLPLTVPRTGWRLAALISYDEARIHARAQLLRTLRLAHFFGDRHGHRCHFLELA